MLSGMFMYLIFVILGFGSGAFKRVPNQCKTKGTIDSLEQNHITRKSRVSHTAVVSYVVEGDTYNVKSSYQSTFFRKGKKLVVKYDEKNPENSFVRTGIIIYLFMFAILITGTLLIVEEIIKFLA